jgi:hypothetical protein
LVSIEERLIREQKEQWSFRLIALPPTNSQQMVMVQDHSDSMPVPGTAVETSLVFPVAIIKRAKTAAFRELLKD